MERQQVLEIARPIRERAWVLGSWAAAAVAVVVLHETGALADVLSQLNINLASEPVSGPSVPTP